MDDFDVKSLISSRNEWVCRILEILTPRIIEGFTIIFNKSVEICLSNHEKGKQLPTFQNLITRIPKWSQDIITKETNRIITESECHYLEDLITCVHIIQLKALTAMRVGQTQKKIDINIPKLDLFIHKIYINCARKIYQNVYLFETDVKPLQIQKNKRELEMIVHECILTTIRKNIPIEEILRAYLDESIEEEVVEEVKESLSVTPPSTVTANELKADDKLVPLLDITDIKDVPPPPITLNSTSATSTNTDVLPAASLTFSDSDMTRDVNNKDENVIAPKDIETLEKISEIKETQRKLEESEENDANKIVISSEPLKIDALDITSLDAVDTITLSTPLSSSSSSSLSSVTENKPLKLNNNDIDLEIIDL